MALAACGGAAPPVQGGSGPAAHRTRANDPQAVDPIAALAPDRETEQVSWLVPGRAQLEIGGTAIEAPGGDRPIEVGVIERQGGLVRVAVRLEHARFSVWTDRARLFAMMVSDQRVDTGFGSAMGAGAGTEAGEIQVVLRRGARVRRLAHKEGSTQVRFVGAVEVEGWVPDRSVGEAGPRRDRSGHVPSGRQTLMVMPGSVIRTEPRWASTALATLAEGYFVDTVRELDAAWVEVAYADADVSVHGYLSRHDPPGRVHRGKDPETPPPAATPNAKVASGTCLYARARGEAIGYVVGDRDVELEDLGDGWWSLAIDTPWGAIAFAAKGAGRGDLTACAPAGSVPPPAPPPGTAPPPVVP
jgi:hypothetical protein